MAFLFPLIAGPVEDRAINWRSRTMRHTVKLHDASRDKYTLTGIVVIPFAPTNIAFYIIELRAMNCPPKSIADNVKDEFEKYVLRAQLNSEVN